MRSLGTVVQPVAPLSRCASHSRYSSCFEKPDVIGAREGLRACRNRIRPSIRSLTHRHDEEPAGGEMLGTIARQLYTIAALARVVKLLPQSRNTGDVTTTGAPSFYSPSVLCDTARARYSFAMEGFFSDDDPRRSVSIPTSGISLVAMRGPGRRRTQRSSARSKKKLVRSQRNSRSSKRRRTPTPKRMVQANTTSSWFAAGRGPNRF